MLRSEIVGKVRRKTEIENACYSNNRSGNKGRTPMPVRNLVRLLQKLPPDCRQDHHAHGAVSVVLAAAKQLPAVSASSSSTATWLSRVEETLRGLETNVCELELAAEVYRIFHLYKIDLAFRAEREDHQEATSRLPIKKKERSGQHMRKRRMSAYNVFFKEYSKRIGIEMSSESSSVGDGIPKAGTYPKLIGEAWGKLCPRARSPYEIRARQINTDADVDAAADETTSVSSLKFNVSTTEDAATAAAAATGSQPTLVSDSECGSPSSSSSISSEDWGGDRHHGNRDLSISESWSTFMEFVHLLVVAARSTFDLGMATPAAVPKAARKPNQLPQVFEVYQLSGPATAVASTASDVGGGEGELQRRIQSSFLAVFDGYDGGGRGGSTRRTAMKLTRQASLLMRDCRVHAAWHSPSEDSKTEKSLWIQINIGRWGQYAEDDTARAAAFDRGRGTVSPLLSTGRVIKKSQKNSVGAEFLAVVVPGTNHVALATTSGASGSGNVASRSRYTPLIVSALESALTCTSADEFSDIGKILSSMTPLNIFCSALTLPSRFRSAGVFFRPIEGLAGSNPYDLLLLASCSTQGQGVVGRFANYDARGKKSDPIAELHTVVTAPLSIHGGVEGDEQDFKQSAVVADSSGGDALIGHSAGETMLRKRTREAAFGRDGDCPRISQLRWEWKGETSAAAACWLGDDDARLPAGEQADEKRSQSPPLPKDRIKCRVSLQGPDVFAGLQALVDAGFSTGPFPGYVRDAPGLGGTIRVEDGAVVLRE